MIELASAKDLIMVLHQSFATALSSLWITYRQIRCL